MHRLQLVSRQLPGRRQPQARQAPPRRVSHVLELRERCLRCDQVPLLAQRTSTITKPILERRTLLAATAAGAVCIPGMRIANWPDKAYSEKVIRPPALSKSARSSSGAFAAPSA